eukprot:scaffold566_cov364-Pavlova_lutheri.AAC.25
MVMISMSCSCGGSVAMKIAIGGAPSRTSSTVMNVVVKRQEVVQQPKFLALCVWRRFRVELGGTENQSAHGAEIGKGVVFPGPIQHEIWIVKISWLVWCPTQRSRSIVPGGKMGELMPRYPRHVPIMGRNSDGQVQY